MDLARRSVLTGLSSTALAFAGLRLLSEAPAGAKSIATGYGPLVPDPRRLLDRLAGEPIDIYVGDRKFAEGEVVVLGEVAELSLVEKAAKKLVA